MACLGTRPHRRPVRRRPRRRVFFRRCRARRSTKRRTARVVVTLTGDLREELPILFLRLRESAVRCQRSIVELAFGAERPSLSRAGLPAGAPGRGAPRRRALGDAASFPRTSPFPRVELDRGARAASASGEGVVFVVGRPNVAEIARRHRTRAARRSPTRFPRRRSSRRCAAPTSWARSTWDSAPRLRPGRGFDAASVGRDTL